MPAPDPLYRTEAEIARAVLGKRADEWSWMAEVFEKDGLPKADPVTGLRYWPAIMAWFQRRAGLGSVDVPVTVDGQENWECQIEVRRQASSGAIVQAANVVPIGSRGPISSKPDTAPRPSR